MYFFVRLKNVQYWLMCVSLCSITRIDFHFWMLCYLKPFQLLQYTTIVVKMLTNIVIDTNNMRSAFSFTPICNIFHMFSIHIIWVRLAAVIVVEFILLLALALANCDTVYTKMCVKKRGISSKSVHVFLLWKTPTKLLPFTQSTHLCKVRRIMQTKK